MINRSIIYKYLKKNGIEYAEAKRMATELSKMVKKYRHGLVLKAAPPSMQDKIDCWLIYVLKLEDGCWYVGRTTQKAFRQRMEDHWNGTSRCSMFTAEHKPLQIYDIEVIRRDYAESQAEAFENAMTIKMARMYGTEYVRGGGYTQREPHWPIGINFNCTL